MKKALISLTLSAALLIPSPSYAIFGVGDIVYDPAAVAELINQVRNTMQMIEQLDTLTKYAMKDHIDLAGGKFREFYQQYTKLFDDIMQEIEGYQNGGLMGQLDRLDQVYWAYYDDWENPETFEEADTIDPAYRGLAKEILWSRIQFKHAAKVGAKIRDSLPTSQAQINTLLDDTRQSPGILQSIKIGNQLTASVAKSLQTLNVSLTEQLQAQAGQGLEMNQRQGLKHNRAREAIKDWGKHDGDGTRVPLNPFERF